MLENYGDGLNTKQALRDTAAPNRNVFVFILAMLLVCSLH